MDVLIMAGGSGTRLWPLSRRNMPKQFLELFEHETSPGPDEYKSLYYLTLLRATSIRADDGRVMVITGENHRSLVQHQSSEAIQIIGEPVGRNTAPCIGLAALWFAAKSPDAVMAALPADHLIEDTEGFGQDLRLAADVAEQTGVLVTFGVKPSTPHTGFGYIEAGAVVPGSDGQVRTVTGFTEKPGQERAQEYLAAGDYFWNAGIFVWRAADILALINQHLPALGEALETVRPHLGSDREAEAVRRFYLDLPLEAATSIDYGVLEPAAAQGRVVMVEASFDWEDVGGWPALIDWLAPSRHWNQDDEGNCFPAMPNPVVHDASGNIIYADRKLVALLGVNDLMVIDANVGGEEVLLVCPKARAEEVRKLVKLVQDKANLEKYL
ncbi:MAG: mannose-1-phosphate guanylyltransferase [Proteobacteria bacterium]|nr:mannose-1-phosphate guanylyltransferase [Pseudomonadota bacterium]MBU1740873.1 mannose-1-phosphate guanylyltransferase [Pseudomonadota bacterium]